MKLSNVVVFALLGAAIAAPTPTLNQASTGSIGKRASITETCTIGYASTNGGTTGGKGGSTTTVSTLAQFTKAAESSGKLNIVVKGSISGSTKVLVASDKTIVGQKGSRITGAGLYIKGVSNVIVRNLAISKVKEAYGDAIGIESSTNVWIDHVDVSSDVSSGKDYYDGLIDITKGSDWITISNSYIHDHYKTSLLGHVNINTSDKGKLHVTYANNYWNNVNSRNPSVRFGTVHIYNNYYNKVGSTGIIPAWVPRSASSPLFLRIRARRSSCPPIQARPATPQSPICHTAEERTQRLRATLALARSHTPLLSTGKPMSRARLSKQQDKRLIFETVVSMSLV